MKIVRISIIALLLLGVVVGGIYPAIVTAAAHLLFPREAAGSLVVGREGRVIGSALIGQPFSGPRYFWPRPSATADRPYNAMASGGSNLGPTNPELLKAVAWRIRALREAGLAGMVPADLATASGSGLDPHITLEAALAQAPRVARARGIAEGELRDIVAAHLEDRQLGFMGRPRVNVLLLNLALDARGGEDHGRP